MLSAGLAGWDQAGQPRRVAQPYMASKWIGICAAVEDMPPVVPVPCSRTRRGHGLERRPRQAHTKRCVKLRLTFRTSRLGYLGNYRCWV
jgi:hypothetical protein